MHDVWHEKYATPYAGLAYVLVFTLARILHTVAYLNHKARLRRDAYTAGFLVLALMAVHVATLGIGKLFG